MSAHVLYRFFDQDGDLLYVGITNNPGRRWSQHRADKPWWSEVHHIEMEHHADRESVLRAEATAIRAERPRHNVIGTVPSPASAPTFLVACGECAFPASAAYLRRDEYAKYRRWADTRDDPSIPMKSRILSGDELFDIPGAASWHISCDNCYPDDEEVQVWFGIDPRSRAGCAERICHFGTKEWVGKYTNWSELSIRLLAPDVAPAWL